MLERRSLKAPVALGVVLIVLVVVFAAIWILANLIAFETETSRTVFWVFLAIGSFLLASILAGVIAYLTLTVKAFRLNQRQSNFIDSVTHELKSPIASLKLYLQTMTQRAVDVEQQQNFHRIMLEDVERLDSLINHLLDVARIDRGLDVADLEPIRLDRLLQQCGHATSLRYKVPGDTVSVDSPPVVVTSQLIQLEILFRNLIDNAVKYGGSPPKVNVKVVHNGEQQAIVSVVDNGPGIPANQRRKVFGRFVRLGNELERSTPGTGLGLYLVRTITKEIGGNVCVRDRSEREGTDVSGTEFEVTLKDAVIDPSGAAESLQPDLTPLTDLTPADVTPGDLESIDHGQAVDAVDRRSQNI